VILLDVLLDETDKASRLTRPYDGEARSISARSEAAPQRAKRRQTLLRRFLASLKPAG